MVVVSSSFTPPAEGILLQTSSTKVLVNDQDVGTGNFYITENNVVWGGGVRPSGAPAPNISLFYPNIALHAIQREPYPALYLVLNYELRLPELAQIEDMNEDDEDLENNDDPMTQIRFIPENENDLQAMYSAMTQGQSLHPDPDDSDDGQFMDGEEFDEGEDEFEDAEEIDAPHEEAASRLRQMHISTVNGTSNPYDDDDEDEDVGDE